MVVVCRSFIFKNGIVNRTFVTKIHIYTSKEVWFKNVVYGIRRPKVFYKMKINRISTSLASLDWTVVPTTKGLFIWGFWGVEEELGRLEIKIKLF